MLDGHGLSRMQTFLLKTLRPSTQDKYLQALAHLNSDLTVAGIVWVELTEAEQDSFLAEWVLDGYESGRGRQDYGCALSAVQKVNPRCVYKTAWKVYDAWGVEAPPRQAPAAPPELITAMILCALLLNRPQLATVMLFCYSGLLRVREALHLRCGDVFVLPDSVTLCLGLTKRGMEQKVVLRHRHLVEWVTNFLRRFPMGTPSSPLFSISYSSVLRWVKKLASFFGAGDLNITTHSFRRSGASELSRQGIPLADILLFGRWLRERSARDYIRRGEVAVLRVRGLLQPGHQQRLHRWGALYGHIWFLFDVLHSGRSANPYLSRLDQVKFDLFERHVLQLIP